MKIIFGLVILIFVDKSLSKHPVLLVPGDGGSQLMAQYIETPPHYICGRQNKWFQLWLDLYFMLPITLDCFVETIRLNYDVLTRNTSIPSFCNVTVPGFGTVDSISYLSDLKVKETSYFYYVINNLIIEHGYVPNKDIRGAPYDFRKAPNEMAQFIKDLQTLVEEMYCENGNQSVVIIGHSLGTVYVNIMLNAMSQEWKDTHVKTFISVSGPYLGAVDAIRTGISGNNEHIFFLSTTKLRPAQSSWPSTYFLMPTPGVWPQKPIVATDKGYFTSYTIMDLLNLSKIEHATDHYKDTVNIKQHHLAPKTSVYCIYSSDVPTPELLDYKGLNFPDDQPIITTGFGDGTVNLFSLQTCSNWNASQTQPVVTYTVSSVAHLEILRDTRFVKYISDVIGILNNSPINGK